MHGLVLGANREISLAVVQTLVTHGFRVGFHQLLHLPAALDHLRRTAYDALIYICHSKTASLNAQPSTHSCANCPVRQLCAAGLRLPILTIAERGPADLWTGCHKAGANVYLAAMPKDPVLVDHFRELVSRRWTCGTSSSVVGPPSSVLPMAPRGKRRQKLAPREAQLVAYLIQNQGRVCTRERICVDAWGKAYQPGSSSVDTCVSRLRDKMGIGSAGPRIETVRGVGYRMNEDGAGK